MFQVLAGTPKAIEQTGEFYLQTTTKQGVQWFDTCLNYLMFGQAQLKFKMKKILEDQREAEEAAASE